MWQEIYILRTYRTSTPVLRMNPKIKSNHFPEQQWLTFLKRRRRMFSYR